MSRRLLLFMLAAFLLAACSGSSNPTTASPASNEAVADAAEVGSDGDASRDEVDGDAETASSSDDDSAIGEAASPDSALAPPAEAFDENAAVATNVEADSATAWISRRSMNATGIELVWSAPEGAAEYQIHRLDRTSDVPPASSEMTANNLVHVGELNGVFLDEGVTEGSLYWYGVRGIDTNETVLSTGWHAAAAVTDEQPPSSVDLAIEQVDGSVLVSWDEPAENFQLHGYRILRAVGTGESEVVSITWDLNQMSFLDDDPPAEQATYSVVAFDFHWNDSVPTNITIEAS